MPDLQTDDRAPDQLQRLQREHTDAVAAKNATDEEIRSLKAKLSDARTTAFRSGRYMDPKHFQRLNKRLSEAQATSQSLMVVIIGLRDKIRDARQAEYKSLAERFMQAAHRILDQETLDEVMAAALDEEEATGVAPKAD